MDKDRVKKMNDIMIKVSHLIHQTPFITWDKLCQKLQNVPVTWIYGATELLEKHGYIETRVLEEKNNVITKWDFYSMKPYRG